MSARSRSTKRSLVSGNSVREDLMYGVMYREPPVDSTTLWQWDKPWDEANNLRKRAEFLLTDPNFIPHDVRFYFPGENNTSGAFLYGHKMFFALASPVFHAMFYGKDRVKGKDVTVKGLSCEGFTCLQKYLYTDGFATVTTGNVFDVLVASQKYQVSRLMRYCYGFIQNNLQPGNAAACWQKARKAQEALVEAQCIAEIKRNTEKVVSSEDFLELPQNLLVEMTDWNDLTIGEFDLYTAVKRRTKHREDNTFKDGRNSKKARTDDVMQHIRFALFDSTQLGEAVEVGDVPEEDLRRLFLMKHNGRNLPVHCRHQPRVPTAAALRLSIRIYGKSLASDKQPQDPRLLGKFDLIIWPDVAPKACRILRSYVEEARYFTLQIDTPNVILCLERVDGSTKPPPFEDGLEEKSVYCAGPASVSVRMRNLMQKSVLRMTIKSPNLSEWHEDEPKEVDDAGLVIGKVLDDTKSFRSVLGICDRAVALRFECSFLT